MLKVTSFDKLIGTKVLNAYETFDKLVKLETDNGDFVFAHIQNCCEQVYIEDVSGGNLSDLIGETIVVAEKTSKIDRVKHGIEEWTFVHIRTNKEDITLRFYGESNGYYSTDITLIEV